MIKKNNRTCICCQKRYTFCPNCSDFDHLPRWMTIFHDENCRKIFNTLMSYNSKKISKEQAKEVLAQCDLRNQEMFKKQIQEEIKEICNDTEIDTVIMATPKLIKNRKRDSVNIVNEE